MKDFFEGFNLGKSGGYELSEECLTATLKDLGMEKTEEEFSIIFNDFFKPE